MHMTTAWYIARVKHNIFNGINSDSQIYASLHKFMLVNYLPYITALQDWIDIDFGIAESVDFIAISFVKTADVIKHLKSYIAARCPQRYYMCSCPCSAAHE